VNVPRGDDFRVADVVRIHSAERGDHVALRHEERMITYAELDERTSRLAQALLAAGAGRGARVAYLDRTAPEAVELLLAAAKVGAVAVPLNWRLAEPELLSVLRDSGAPLLIAGPTYAETAHAITGELAATELVIVDGDDPHGYEAWLAAHEPRDPGSRGEAEICEKRDLADARARVDAALAKINPRYATAIRLRVLDEKPREEVAATLGVTVATFDVVLHRAIAALKKALAADGEGGGA
jgi:RNA polymerase sigma factor (sigma-70 family)